MTNKSSSNAFEKVSRKGTEAKGDGPQELGKGKGPPTVSVVIPCYNLGQYLYEAVDSVLAQTWKDFEVIIVNDGSTDPDTCTLLDSFDRPNARIVHQTNQGLAAARNNGIAQSNGKYISCLDADDRLKPNFLDKAVKILDGQPGVGFVTGFLELIGEREGIYRFKQSVFPELLVNNQVVVPALFRKEAWVKAGGFCGNFSVSGIEDWDFWISILEAGYRSYLIPEPVHDYRIRDDSMSVPMRRPENWSTLIVELGKRHEKSYKNYFFEVLKKYGYYWAEVLIWCQDLEKTVKWWEKESDQKQSWIDNLEAGKKWWEEQAGTWKQLAERREQTIQEHQAGIGKLEEAKTWWEQQATNWQHIAEEREHTIREYQAGIGKLEEAKTWWEQQATNWQHIAEEREHAIQEQQSWIDNLEAGKKWWEEQAGTWKALVDEQGQMIREQQAYIEKLEKSNESYWRRMLGQLKNQKWKNFLAQNLKT